MFDVFVSILGLVEATLSFMMFAHLGSPKGKFAKMAAPKAYLKFSDRAANHAKFALLCLLLVVCRRCG